MQNTVHFILQGKGGIGKTLVSTILAQWIASKDVAEDHQPLRCYDTDQENATFSRYKAMDVKHVPVMTDSRNIDPKRFDALMIDILERTATASSTTAPTPSRR
jgi:CO dehydrogenase nickel-insertion accessory protein CooC1